MAPTCVRAFSVQLIFEPWIKIKKKAFGGFVKARRLIAMKR